MEGEGANHVQREPGVIAQVFHALGIWRGVRYVRCCHHTVFIPLLISIPGATSCVDAALAVDLPTSLVATIMKPHESPYKNRRHIHGPSGLC